MKFYFFHVLVEVVKVMKIIIIITAATCEKNIFQTIIISFNCIFKCIVIINNTKNVK